MFDPFAALCYMHPLPIQSSPRGEKDITQVSGTCSPRSIRGGGMISHSKLALISLYRSDKVRACGGGWL